MTKKKLFSIVGGVAILGTAALIPLSVAAAEATTGEDTFISKLAAKLGIDESTVETAVDATRDEMQAERDQEVAAEIAQAVTDGEITQRQADILIAEMDVRETLREEMEANREDLSSLTEEERRTKMEELRDEMEQKMLDALNAKGLNTTTDEIQEAHDAARDAGIRAGGPRGRGMGPGGMGRM